MGSNEVIDFNNIRVKENSFIAKLAASRLKVENVAIVLGNTIHLHNVSRDDFLQDEKLLKHELCHIKQFKENGYPQFVIKYLWESIKHGYRQNKYEIEARTAEEL